jgi:phenylpropionate dioxygenase-like ring-hydroxylating dioxygenase large terminal subunit
MPPTTARPLDATELDPADLDQVLLEFGRSRMLPRAAYTSERVLAFELERLFAGSWVCVARDADLAGPGDQMAVRVGGVGVLLVRDQGGRLAAFANVCRHRGHELLEPGGSASAKSLVCPYHAWAYRLDGSLRAAPGMRELPGFEPRAHGLARLPLAVWHGFVLVNASGDGPPLEAHLGALDRLVAPYRPERLVAMASHEYTPRANWKVLCENYHECYHCPRIHPELCQVSPPSSGSNHALPGAWVGGSMELREHAVTMSLDGQSAGVPIQGLEGRRLRTVDYLHLLPNLLLSLHPDYLMTHLVEPLAPDRSRIVCTWYFPPEAAGRPGFDPAYAVEFWDRTNLQDWAACESVQRGLANPHYRPGPLAPGEGAVYRFETMLARAYLGGSPAGA